MREATSGKKPSTISNENTSGSGKSRVAPNTGIHFKLTQAPKRKEQEERRKGSLSIHKKHKKDTTEVSDSSLKGTKKRTKKDATEREDPKPVLETFIEAMKEAKQG